MDRVVDAKLGGQCSYANGIKGFDPDNELNEEQVGIMAMIAVKAQLTDAQLRHYTWSVTAAQRLMPSGRVRSRQILTLLALKVVT